MTEKRAKYMCGEVEVEAESRPPTALNGCTCLACLLLFKLPKKIPKKVESYFAPDPNGNKPLQLPCRVGGRMGYGARGRGAR